MNWGWGAPKADALCRHIAAPGLFPHRVVFVSVCGFTFEFHDGAQAQACLDYYSQKVHPSARLPVNTGDFGGDHWEVQRWFDRLPLRLREEPKRLRVVKALEQTVAQWERLAT